MKKVKLFAAMAAVVFASCNTDENLEFEMGNHTITASMETDAPETRTAFDQTSGALYWISGDNIAVLNTNGSFTEYTLTKGAGTANATFSGTKIGSNSNYALHPYSSHKYENSELTFNLPTSYTYVDAEKGNEYGAAPMIAQTDEADASNFYFEHLGGAFCFTINNLPANTTYFKFEADEQITGEFPIEENAETNKFEISLPNTQAVSGFTYDVTINFPAEESATNKKFFIPLPVGTIEGFKISLGTSEGETWSYTSTASNTITRKKLLAMPEVTLNATVDGTLATSVANLAELKSVISSGGKVILTSDITEVSELLKVEKDLVLDLNGHTLAFTPQEGYPGIKNTAKFEVKDSKTAGKITSTQVGIQNNGTLVVNCDMETGAGNAINNVYDGETTINGGTYKNTSTDKALINSNNYDNGTPVLTINGGSFESVFTNVSYNNSTTGAVNAGTFKCTGGWHNIYVGGENGGCNVTYNAENCTFESNGVNIQVNNWGVESNKNTLNNVEYTGVHNVVYASTMASLNKAISSGGKVILTSDITGVSELLKVEKDLVLDLNGHTLAFTPQEGYPGIKNTAKFEVKDSKTAGKITSTQVGIQNNGTLVVNCDMETGAGNAINNVYDGETTINGGTYKNTSTDKALINSNNYDNGTPVLTINGGSFESVFTNVSYNNSTTGTVNAGTFKCTGGWHNIYVGGENGGCNVTYNAENCTFESNGVNIQVNDWGKGNTNTVNNQTYTSTTTLME